MSVKTFIRNVAFISRFLIILVISVAFVAYRETLFTKIAKWTRPKGPVQVEVKGEKEYYCPMHPSVVRDQPGNCPICGMPLALRTKTGQLVLPEGVTARVQLSPYRIQLAGVKTEEVTYRYLTKEIRTVGLIEYDERKVRHLSARIAGRADKLYVNFTGTTVKKGDPVYEIYSPDLVSTQKEYLLALEHKRALEGKGNVQALEEAKALEASAEKRLLLWGITPEQIARLSQTQEVLTHLTIASPISGVVIEKDIHEGHYVEVGEDPYTVADLSTVWMLANIYEDEMAWVRRGQWVEITTPTFPSKIFKGKVSFVDPFLDKETRSVKIRVDVKNKGLKLKPGMYVNAKISIPMTDLEKSMKLPALKVSYTCPMHEGEVSETPGFCPKCGGELKESSTKLVALGSEASEGVVYSCPMHPEIVQNNPGKCPICGMNLVEERGGMFEKSSQLCICPVHADQTAEAPKECPMCGMKMKLREVGLILSVPESAVIDTGIRKVVYVETAPGVYDGVEVQLGPLAGDFYPVLKGLKEGDRVVSQGAFLIDAEARLNPAAAGKYFGASGGPEKPQAKPHQHQH